MYLNSPNFMYLISHCPRTDQMLPKFKSECIHINFDRELQVVTSRIKCHQKCSDLTVLCKTNIMDRFHNYLIPCHVISNYVHGITLQNTAISLFTSTKTLTLMQNITVKGTALQLHKFLCLQAVKFSTAENTTYFTVYSHYSNVANHQAEIQIS